MFCYGAKCQHTKKGLTFLGECLELDYNQSPLIASFRTAHAAGFYAQTKIITLSPNNTKSNVGL